MGAAEALARVTLLLVLAAAGWQSTPPSLLTAGRVDAAVLAAGGVVLLQFAIELLLLMMSLILSIALLMLLSLLIASLIAVLLLELAAAGWQLMLPTMTEGRPGAAAPVAGEVMLMQEGTCPLQLEAVFTAGWQSSWLSPAAGTSVPVLTTGEAQVNAAELLLGPACKALPTASVLCGVAGAGWH